MAAKSIPGYDGQSFTLFADLTEVRLTVDIPEDDKLLISWTNYCLRENIEPKWKRAAELTAQFSPLVSAYTRDETRRVDAKIRQGRLKLQGNTWWFYEETVPVSYIVSIEDRVKSGKDYKIRD